MISRGEIIQMGLAQAGRPDLISDARLWLNLFLEEQYTNQDWNWLVKAETGMAASQGGELPFDFRAAKSALIGYSGNMVDLNIVGDRAAWDDLRRTGGNTTGQPTHAYFDPTTKTVEFHPIPVSGLIWDLSYYYLPELPEDDDPLGDDQIPVWGLPSKILCDHIKAMAFEYNDDSRQEKAFDMVEKAIEKAKMNNSNRRAGHNKIPLGKSFKRRF